MPTRHVEWSKGDRRGLATEVLDVRGEVAQAAAIPAGAKVVGRDVDLADYVERAAGHIDAVEAANADAPARRKAARLERRRAELEAVGLTPEQAAAIMGG